MNAKARRAELSKMIDGTNYRYRSASTRASKANKQRRRTNEYSSSASKAEFPYVHTQLAICLIWRTIVKNLESNENQYKTVIIKKEHRYLCLLYTSPSPRD